jgi:hypothetical protein
MDGIRVIGKHLLKVATLLKSQKKIDGERLDELREAIVLHSLAWRKYMPSRPIWVKLHRLECHIMQFVETWGCIGILSEEGFESFHTFLNALVEAGSNQ